MSVPEVFTEPRPEAFVEEFTDSTINVACRFLAQARDRVAVGRTRRGDALRQAGLRRRSDHHRVSTARSVESANIVTLRRWIGFDYPR